MRSCRLRDCVIQGDSEASHSLEERSSHAKSRGNEMRRDLEDFLRGAEEGGSDLWHKLRAQAVAGTDDAYQRGRQVYDEAVRTGQDVVARTPTEVARLGRAGNAAVRGIANSASLGSPIRWKQARRRLPAWAGQAISSSDTRTNSVCSIGKMPTLNRSFRNSTNGVAAPARRTKSSCGPLREVQARAHGGGVSRDLPPVALRARLSQSSTTRSRTLAWLAAGFLPQVARRRL